MKTLRLFITALFAFLFFSCSGLNLEDNRGSITLRLPSKESSVRGIETRAEQKLSYLITLLDQKEKKIDKQGGIPGDTVTFSNINEGSYIVSCECFIDINGEEKLYAQAKDNAEVKAGQTATVTLYLELQQEFIPEDPLPEEIQTPEAGEKEENEPSHEVIPSEPNGDDKNQNDNQITEPKDPENENQVVNPKEDVEKEDKPEDNQEVETPKTEENQENNQITEPKEEETVPGSNTPTDPKQEETVPDDGPQTDPKQEETVPDDGPQTDPKVEIPSEYKTDFENAENLAFTNWDEFAEKINALPETKAVICSFSGTYEATSQISIKFGRKVLLTASADTTINAKCTSGDLFSISSGILIVAGTKDANITFKGEMPNSIFNVDGSKAKLTVMDNVDIKDFTCTNQYAGGAVYVAQGICSINGGVTFTNCKATKSNGGAINAVGGQLYITGSTAENPVTFNNCSANKDGGAIYINASEHRDGYIQLSDIVFGSEEGNENSCGTDYCSRDIYINSIDEVSVYLTGNFWSADSKVEVFAASYFILGSDTETTADLNITFDSNFFDEAISNDMQIIFTYDAYEEALLNHISVRPLSSPDWKRIDETGHVIND